MHMGVLSAGALVNCARHAPMRMAHSVGRVPKVDRAGWSLDWSCGCVPLRCALAMALNCWLWVL